MPHHRSRFLPVHALALACLLLAAPPGGAEEEGAPEWTLVLGKTQLLETPAGYPAFCEQHQKTTRSALRAKTVAKLKGAMDTAIFNKWGNKPPASIKKPIHDGDGEKPNGGEYGPECAGCWVLNLRTKDKPGVVDINVQDVIDPDEFVSGDYCRLSINAFAYDTKGNRGVSFGLNNVQVSRKGETLSGRARAEDDFNDGWGGGGDAGASDNDPPW